MRAAAASDTQTHEECSSCMGAISSSVECGGVLPVDVMDVRTVVVVVGEEEFDIS